MFVDKAGTAAAIQDDNDFYPWGGVVPGVGKTTSTNTVKFTDKYRDSESQLDYFGARYYANITGRFMTPDWAAKPIAVPYADFGDPQSLNLYAYVRNSPIVRVDLDGHSFAGWNGAGANTSGGFTDLDNNIESEMGVYASATANVDAMNAAEQASRQQQQSGPRIGIGIEEPNASAVNNGVLDASKDPGHTFVYLKNKSGEITSLLSFGPSESIGVSNGTRFKVGNLPGDAHWPLSGTVKAWEIPVSTKQANAIMKAITEFKASPPHYTPTMQCTSAALSIASKAGITLPSGVGPVKATTEIRGHTFTVWSGNVANPFHLSQQMTNSHGPPTLLDSTRFPIP